MKKKLSYSSLIRLILIAAVAGSITGGCSKMDDTFKDFIKDGQIVYVGKADQAEVHPGRNRLVLAWPTPSDPKAVKAKIYWNNRADSVEIPIDQSASAPDTVLVPFNDLPEGPYVFEVYTFDNEGHQSVMVEVRGKVYGDTYENALLSRPIDHAELADDTLNIEWGALPDTTAIGSEVVYKDADGIEQTLYVSGKSLLTRIPDFVPQTFKHRTVYLPKLAVDTFYTDYINQKIKGPPVEISKTGWTVTASSEDVKGKRYAANLIDGNLTNLFVNEIVAGNEYPHTATVDMGKVADEIEGFCFYQRSINQLKTVEIQISMDGLSWQSLGDFILSDTPRVDTNHPELAVPVYAQLASPESFRYFKQIYKNDYGNSKNVNLHEIGVYTR